MGVRSVLPKARVAAVAAFIAVVALTVVLDWFARSAYQSEVRSDTSAGLDALARTLSDVIARETASANTMAVFVEVTGFESENLREIFPIFAESLMREGSTIRSVQLAPGNVLEFVYPLAGNEAAVGLDLLADSDRRAILLPSIESGTTVMQGPFELIQGGRALAVRHPVYRTDGSFWGFAAVILDWVRLTEITGFDSLPSRFVAGVRLPGDDRVIAGDPRTFEGDPLQRTIEVGATDTTWTIAMRPADGWPTTSNSSGLIWLFGSLTALLVATVTHNAVKRPELLEAERIAALADLARSEATFHATFQHAGVGIVIGDSNGRLVSANPTFCEIVGRRLDEIEGIELIELIGDERHREFERAMVRSFRQGTVVDMDVRIVGVQEPKWGQVRVTTIPGEGRLFVAIVQDITDRLLADIALADSEERFRRLFEHAPIPIQREDHSAAKSEVDALTAQGIDIRSWYVEDDERLRSLLSRVMITDLNPAARQLQESRLGAGIGPGPLVRHYTDNARDGFISTLQAIARGETMLEYEVMTNTADGALVHLDLKWQVPIIDGEPDYSNVMLSLHDSTDLRETERRLQQEVESKDRFLASVAHELRTPLTAVVGFAHELQEESGVYSDDERREFQKLIAFHSSELAHLIEDLLVWARADIGEVQVRAAAMDLAACVDECVGSMPDVKVQLDWVAGPTFAHADSARVRQIIRNLVTNAVRYGGPDVRVAVSDNEDWSAVEVSDDGEEIPFDQQEAIFAAYTRAESSPSMTGSIGLGLTVSRTLARLQEGDLVFVREHDRNIFRLLLPKPAVVSSGDLRT